MVRTSLAIAAAVISAAWVSSAVSAPDSAALPEHSADFFKCMDAVDYSAFKNSQWQACYQAELDRAEKRLASIEKQRLTAYPKKADELALAFHSWRHFRDHYCSMTATDGDTPNEDQNRLDCMALLTVEQATMLENGI